MNFWIENAHKLGENGGMGKKYWQKANNVGEYGKKYYLDGS
jgi:hypothetical protein